MSVPRHYPFNGSKNRLRMGLSSISASEWIEYEDDFSKRTLVKKNLISEQKHRVIQSIEGSEDAQHELLNNILSFIRQYKSDLFTINENSVISHADNNIYEFAKFKTSPLELISYLAADDFCLLDKFNDDYRLAAATVCAPTYWELSEKMGRPMKDVHSPIANLEDKIGRMIRHYFSNLKTDDYYQRSNWFLVTTSDLPLFKINDDMDNDIDGFDISSIPNNLYLRCERQSFRKLKQTEYIAFGIKVYVSPLSIVTKHTEIAEDIILAVNTMNAEQKQLMGIDSYEEPLLAYLKSIL